MVVRFCSRKLVNAIHKSSALYTPAGGVFPCIGCIINILLYCPTVPPGADFFSAHTDCSEMTHPTYTYDTVIIHTPMRCFFLTVCGAVPPRADTSDRRSISRISSLFDEIRAIRTHAFVSALPIH